MSVFGSFLSLGRLFLSRLNLLFFFLFSCVVHRSTEHRVSLHCSWSPASHPWLNRWRLYVAHPPRLRCLSICLSLSIHLVYVHLVLPVMLSFFFRSFPWVVFSGFCLCSIASSAGGKLAPFKAKAAGGTRFLLSEELIPKPPPGYKAVNKLQWMPLNEDKVREAIIQSLSSLLPPSSCFFLSFSSLSLISCLSLGCHVFTLLDIWRYRRSPSVTADTC